MSGSFDNNRINPSDVFEVTLSGFTGLRNNVAPERFKNTDLLIAKNIDIDDDGALRRRKGYTKKISGSIHSLWSEGEVCLFRTGNDLCRMYEDYSYDILRADMYGSAKVDYFKILDRVFYTDGIVSGVVQGSASRSWGLKIPTPPVLTAIPGVMLAGRYQFALSYSRNDGQGSGLSIGSYLDILDNQGVNISYLSSNDPTVDKIKIYMTSRNGDVFYYLTAVDNISSNVNMSTTTDSLTLPTITQFLNPAPAGQLIEYYASRMWIAQMNNMYYSQVQNYELFSIDSYIPLPDNITMMAMLDKIMLIGTTNFLYMMTDKGNTFEIEHKLNCGVVRGTCVKTDASKLKAGVADDMIIFLTTESGICLGFPDGTVKTVTNDRYDFVKGSKGTATLIEQEGMNKYIVSTEVIGG